MDKVRWKMIEVPNINSGDIKNKIEFKIPQSFKLLTGIMFGATDEAGAFTAGIYGNYAASNILGVISLHINNKQSNILQYPVQIIDYGNLQRKFKPLPFQEPLKGGTMIQGYFIDAGYANIYPYKLKIYLQGIK